MNCWRRHFLGFWTTSENLAESISLVPRHRTHFRLLHRWHPIHACSHNIGRLDVLLPRNVGHELLLSSAFAMAAVAFLPNPSIKSLVHEGPRLPLLWQRPHASRHLFHWPVVQFLMLRVGFSLCLVEALHDSVEVQLDKDARIALLINILCVMTRAELLGLAAQHWLLRHPSLPAPSLSHNQEHASVLISLSLQRPSTTVAASCSSRYRCSFIVPAG